MESWRETKRKQHQRDIDIAIALLALEWDEFSTVVD